MQTPTISVIMAVYNNQETVRAATESILKQSFTDFEFIIIDDGSIDQSSKILNDLASKDKRIKLISQENHGLTTSLNRGLSYAKGQYIARMDADDISLTNRLELQYQFLRQNPHIGVCGTQMELFGAKNGKSTVPTSPQEINIMLLFRPPVFHPTVMIRHSILQNNNLQYDPSFVTAQDYDLWVRLSKFTDIANLPQFLLCYRISEQQITAQKREAQLTATFRIYTHLLQQFLIAPTYEELQIHLATAWHNVKKSETRLADVDAWLNKLITANQQYNIYPQQPFAKYLADLWYLACREHRGGLATWRQFVSTPLSQFVTKDKWFKLLAHVLFP
jgi:glycosyltransferase involved in cell wall biosynthesis